MLEYFRENISNRIFLVLEYRTFLILEYFEVCFQLPNCFFFTASAILVFVTIKKLSLLRGCNLRKRLLKFQPSRRVAYLKETFKERVCLFHESNILN